MNRLRKTISAIGLIAITAIAALIPSGANANEISGRGLLEGMAKVADRYAQASWSLGRIEDSVNWSSWALLYRGQLRAVPAKITASYLAQHAIQASRQYAQQSAQIGNPQLARFYSASAAFWQDVYQQLTRGAVALQIRFPREMTVAINGAPGTPWAPWGETKLPGTGGISGFPMGGFPAGGLNPAGGAANPTARGQICPACGGAGKSVCFTCKGTGEENYQAFANFYGLSDDAAESLARRTRHTCTSCGGSGFKKCIGCGGTGRLGGR